MLIKNELQISGTHCALQKKVIDLEHVLRMFLLKMRLSVSQFQERLEQITSAFINFSHMPALFCKFFPRFSRSRKKASRLLLCSCSHWQPCCRQKFMRKQSANFLAIPSSNVCVVIILRARSRLFLLYNKSVRRCVKERSEILLSLCSDNEMTCCLNDSFT